MKLYRAPISGIPFTPREKRRKTLKTILLAGIFVAVFGGLALTGVFSRIFSKPAASTGEISSQPAALIAETGVRVFTSISPENGYESWELNLCSLSTERFCSLVKSGLGDQVWDSALVSDAGIVNLSAHAIRRVYPNPGDEETQQFWQVRYELVSTQGEQTYSAVVSVVRETGKWKFNGFSLLPEPTPEGVLRGFQEE